MTRVTDPLAGLTPEQRAAAEIMLRQRRAGAQRTWRIGRRANQGEYPLSFAQQRLWFVEELNPGGAANHIAGAVRIEGRLSHQALERGLAEIVRRHEILRSAYTEEGGRPVQFLAPHASSPIPVVGIDGDSLAARLDGARRLVAREAERPFDLSAAPLLRASLFRLSDDDHVLLIVLHHIAGDGWSMGVLARELSLCYGAFLEQRPSPLPALSIQYADFAAWQREYVSGARLADQVEWWRAQLRDMPALEVPADRPRAAVPTSGGARSSIELPGDLMAALTTLSRRHGATLFMTLLAAFQTLLLRWSGQTDIGVSSPVAGRNWREVEPLIGLFVNTLVLRTDLSGHPSFADLLARVRASVTGAIAHQDVPFDTLVDELQVDRSLSRTALTPVVFALQNVPTSGLVFPEARLSVFDVERSTSRFDLCLFVQETLSGFVALMEYSTDLFDRPRIDRMLRSYVRLLESIVADPGQHVGSLPIVDDAERQRLLVGWNATRHPYPRDSAIPRLVEGWAAATPDAIALSCLGEQLTYAALDRQATVLAHALSARGVRPGDRVGVCVDRSIDLMVVLLAVLKAGGAYVPLDAAYPPTRLKEMVACAGVDLIVAETRHTSAFVAGPAAIVSLDELRAAVAHDSGAGYRVDPRPDDLAYISFTSGSTGVPKGVEVSHRAVIRLLCGVDYVDLGARESFLQLAPVAFDASTFEIWGALLHGGRLAIYPERGLDFDVLERTLAVERVTTLWLTASLFNAVVDRAPTMLQGVRQLLIGGEALSREHVRRAMDALPDTRIINGYGPTEGTTFTCCHLISRADVESSRSIPIGRPISNTEVFVLDAALEPVPIGVPGELCIGGDGLARGYASAPRLTAARFAPDGLSGRPGARLYRTGDRAQYSEDGTIEFLGRRDGQVKLRGYRIELGEIEAVLMRHPDVAAAVAVVNEIQGRPTLAAYVVRRAGEAARDADLRAFLKVRLPDYMLPAVLVPIDAVPLTPNGKVDREALPTPPLERTAHQKGAAPRNEMDTLVVETCCELLGTSEVGVFDNFFELGGHSLLVTQLASRLKRALQADVSIRTIFESRTLAELSDQLVDLVLESPDESIGTGG